MSFQKPKISPPWRGIVDTSAKDTLDPSSWSDARNFFLRDGRIKSANELNTFTGPPNSKEVLGGKTFKDVLNNWHTVLWTEDQPYHLTSTSTYTEIGSVITLPQSGVPFALEVILGRVYFANGGDKVRFVDGSASHSVSGDVPGTALFMGQLANRLILAHTIEPETGDTRQVHQRRVRWSASGDPDDWTSFGAGFNDISEVEDDISGYVTLGQHGYVFRTAGITLMTPTSIGLAPFRFENFSEGPTGIGNEFPYTLGKFGRACAFPGSDDIYALEAGGIPQRIGSNATNAIFTDLQNRVADPIGTMLPTLGKSVDYLSYWLAIPLAAELTRIWIYLFSEQSWIPLEVPTVGATTFIEEIAVI